MEEPKTRAARRMRALLDQLGRERDYRHGWQSDVARDLGISQNYVSKLHRGDRATVGLEIMERVSRALGIDRGFFLDPVAQDPPNYRDFQTGRDERWLQLVEEVIEEEHATDEEAEMLRSIRSVGKLPPNKDTARWALERVQMILMRQRRGV